MRKIYDVTEPPILARSASHKEFLEARKLAMEEGEEEEEEGDEEGEGEEGEEAEEVEEEEKPNPFKKYDGPEYPLAKPEVNKSEVMK